MTTFRIARAARRLAPLTLVAACVALAGCPRAKGDSQVVAAGGARLSADAIDGHRLALLPSRPVGVATFDVAAFVASPLGAEATRLVARWVPLGSEAGFAPERDLRRVIVGAYSMTGVDGVAVAEGDFHPELIRAAADRRATTPGGSVLVRSVYAGEEVFTAGNVGIVALTPHTLLAGSEIAMRRALDRIRDGRVEADVPEWMASALASPKAPLVAVADFTAESQVAAASTSLPFLSGVKNARVLGNFQAPGMNLVGTLSYPDASAAERAGTTLRNLAQLANVLGGLSGAWTGGSPLKSLDTKVVDADVQFAAVLDGATLASLAAKIPSPAAVPSP